MQSKTEAPPPYSFLLPSSSPLTHHAVFPSLLNSGVRPFRQRACCIPPPGGSWTLIHEPPATQRRAQPSVDLDLERLERDFFPVNADVAAVPTGTASARNTDDLQGLP